MVNDDFVYDKKIGKDVFQDFFHTFTIFSLFINDKAMLSITKAMYSVSVGW